MVPPKNLFAEQGAPKSAIVSFNLAIAVEGLVATETQRDQVFRAVVSKATSRSDVMNL
jgi:hypothetical protein